MNGLGRVGGSCLLRYPMPMGYDKADWEGFRLKEEELRNVVKSVSWVFICDGWKLSLFSLDRLWRRRNSQK